VAGGSPATRPIARRERQKRVTLAIMTSTDLPWSRQRAATVIAAYAACRRLVGGVSDVATTTTARAGADHMIGTVWGRGYMIRDPGAPLNKAMASALRQPMPVPAPAEEHAWSAA
jgi:hypothetical protein